MAAVKEKVIELLKTLPENVTVEDVIDGLYCKLQVDQGLAELDRCDGIPHAEIERRMAKWRS